MGAGASVEGIPADKMDRFKEKLMNVDSMKDEQKLRLLEQMAYELKKVSPKDETDVAAAKIQSLQRAKQAKPASGQGNMSGGSLEEVFNSFCATYRQTTMTNTVFAKFCKDAKILDSKFSKPDIDMVWSKVAGKEKKVSYSLFVKFLEEIAKKKGVEYAEVEGHVMTNAQVSSSGTTGESRFYDDKSTWTGAAVKGGPTTNDNTVTLQNLTANK